MESIDTVFTAVEKSFVPVNEQLAAHYDAALITIDGLDPDTRATLAQYLSAVHQDTVLAPHARSIFASHGMPQIAAYVQLRQQTSRWTSADIATVIEEVTRAMAAQVLLTHREAARFIAY